MSQDALMDTRTVERNIKSGKISQEDYQNFLASLEDCAEEGEETETKMIHHRADEEETEA